jgi:hypothetical protein
VALHPGGRPVDPSLIAEKKEDLMAEGAERFYRRKRSIPPKESRGTEALRASGTSTDAGRTHRIRPLIQPFSTPCMGVKQAGSLFRGLLTCVLTGMAAISPAG